MYTRTCSALLGLLAAFAGILGANSTASANQFTLVNRSGKTVHAAIGFFVPGSSSTSAGLAVFTPNRWVTVGWYIVKSGDEQVLYTGPSDKVRLRINFENDSKPLVPWSHDGEKSVFVTPGNRFVATYDIGSDQPVRLKYGSNLEYQTDSVRREGYSMDLVGFYLVPANQRFTVNP